MFSAPQSQKARNLVAQIGVLTNDWRLWYTTLEVKQRQSQQSRMARHTKGALSMKPIKVAFRLDGQDLSSLASPIVGLEVRNQDLAVLEVSHNVHKTLMLSKLWLTGLTRLIGIDTNVPVPQAVRDEEMIQIALGRWMTHSELETVLDSDNAVVIDNVRFMPGHHVYNATQLMHLSFRGHLQIYVDLEYGKLLSPANHALYVPTSRVPITLGDIIAIHGAGYSWRNTLDGGFFIGQLERLKGAFKYNEETTELFERRLNLADNTVIFEHLRLIELPELELICYAYTDVI